MVETIQVIFWIVEYKLLCAGRKYLSVVTQISHFFLFLNVGFTKCFRLMTYPSKCQKYIGCSTAVCTVNSTLANSRKRSKTCRDTYLIEDFYFLNHREKFKIASKTIHCFYEFFLLVKPGKLKLSKWAQILRGFSKL